MTTDMTRNQRPKKEKKQVKTVEYPAGVRFSYLRDKDSNGRVLSLARVYDKESNTVKFGWSINQPSQWRVTEEGRTKSLAGEVVTQRIVREHIKGDNFCRKDGRERAIERMKDAALVAVLDKNQIPLQAALDYLINEADRLELPYHVKRIARQYVNDLPSYSEVSEHPAPLKSSFLDRLMRRLRGGL